jgi:hypothetical protein
MAYDINSEGSVQAIQNKMDERKYLNGWQYTDLRKQQHRAANYSITKPAYIIQIYNTWKLYYLANTMRVSVISWSSFLTSITRDESSKPLLATAINCA